mgnify:FL=1
MPEQASVKLHSHPTCLELVLITNGSGLHLLGDHEYPIASGDAFVIHPNDVHGYQNTRDLGLINILFKPEQLHLPEFDLQDLAGYQALFHVEPQFRQKHLFHSRLRLKRHDLARVTAIIDMLEQEMEQEEPGHVCMTVVHMTSLICDLSRCYERSRAKDTMLILRLSKVLNLLEEHYSRPVRLEEMSKAAHMSERSLRRAFLEVTGNSPTDYLNTIRLERAAELLRQSELQISDVALQCGFSDASYFASQFKRTFRTSPTRFRQRYKLTNSSMS